MSVQSDSLRQALLQVCQPVRRRNYPRSLATIQALLHALGDPQRDLQIITVTGSSGKSSVCHHLAALLQASGLRTGCFLSPHLHSFRERILLDGRPIGVNALCEGAALVARAAAGLPGAASTFERSTALALWWFRQCEARWLVLETGLGGRFDAVNAARNRLALFTGIEAEHKEWLGGSLASVAWHKAGIIQARGTGISAAQSPAVSAILQDEAARQGARLHFSDLDLALAARRHLAATGQIRERVDAAAARPAALPGRMEMVSPAKGPPVLIDGGHTAAAAHYLRAGIERQPALSAGDGVRIIAGFLKDKNAAAWLQAFDDPRFSIALTRAPGHRSADPQELLAASQLHQAWLHVEPGLATALQRARNSDARLVVVSGSLRLAARARIELGLLSAGELAEAALTEQVFSGPDYLARLFD